MSAPAPTTGTIRFWLRADAVVTGVNGMAYLLAAPVVEALTGVPAGWLRGLGTFLVVFAVAVAAVGGLGASDVGRVWILVQAVVVAVLAEQQVRNLPA